MDDGPKPPDELRAIARSIVDANTFMTLATADADGRPWASPLPAMRRAMNLAF